MIVGVGIDIIEIERIAEAYQRWGGSFLRKVFTESEIAYCLSKRDPAPSLAARFAAKEAGFKALSQAGIHVVKWRSIEVRREPGKAPELVVAGLDLSCRLSLTHSRDYAAAVVVAEE